MSNLVNRKNALPTRKILAVILSGAVIGALQAGLHIFWPDHPFGPLMEELDVWIQAGVMVVAGYMTKERESSDVDAT